MTLGAPDNNTKKRYTFLFRRQKKSGLPVVCDEDMKNIHQMTPHEVDAEIKMRVAQMQRVGLLPCIDCPQETATRKVTERKALPHDPRTIAARNLHSFGHDDGSIRDSHLAHKRIPARFSKKHK